ncbi:hypothetical protein HXX25_06365 [Hyphobacterium sp. CCMP332]|uniref:hypothetical protein n=1 Tax=Hyphobacterium sp. CCMP332 TaxID=2749086 RepID=UPI00164F255A|nr:hypothetical protein HXX25_06365 [Hyphobacterium sp. CCMP332]
MFETIAARRLMKAAPAAEIEPAPPKMLTVGAVQPLASAVGPPSQRIPAWKADEDRLPVWKLATEERE